MGDVQYRVYSYHTSTFTSNPSIYQTLTLPPIKNPASRNSRFCFLPVLKSSSRSSPTLFPTSLVHPFQIPLTLKPPSPKLLPQTPPKFMAKRFKALDPLPPHPGPGGEVKRKRSQGERGKGEGEKKIKGISKKENIYQQTLRNQCR